MAPFFIDVKSRRYTPWRVPAMTYKSNCRVMPWHDLTDALFMYFCINNTVVFQWTLNSYPIFSRLATSLKP